MLPLEANVKFTLSVDVKSCQPEEVSALTANVIEYHDPRSGSLILIEAFAMAPGGPFIRLIFVGVGTTIPADAVPHEIGSNEAMLKLPVVSFKLAVE